MTIRIPIIVLSLFTFFVARTQKFQTVEEVQEQCGQLSFLSNQEAEIAVDQILEQFGLTRTFVIQECPDIKNAVAKIVQISPNYKERYIFYDSDFLDKADGDSSDKWGAYFILAHEIGHHLNGHSLDITGSTPPYELEADFFSGTAMGLLGATLEDAQRAIEVLITYEKATATHPAKKDRLEAIEKGWNKAKNRNKRNSIKMLTEEIVNVSNGNNLEVLPKDNKKMVSLNNQAVDAYEQKNYTKAADYSLKAYQYSSGDLGFLDFAATNYVLAKELDTALRYFLIIVKKGYQGLNEQSVYGVNQQIGLIYYAKNQTEDALKFFEILLRSEPDDADIYINMADLYIKQREESRAMEYALLATEKSIVKPYTSYNIGRVFFLLRDYEKAAKYYRQTISKDNSYHNAYLDLSSVYLSAGNATANEINASLNIISESEYTVLKSKMDDYYKSAVVILEEGIRALPNAPGLRNRLRTVTASIPK